MGNNRAWNAHNPNQGDWEKALVVCSAGLLRSPTVAWILSNEPFNMNTRAVGSSPSFALIPVDKVLLDWADTIVFVNEENYLEVCNHFPEWETRADQRVIVLDLPDNFRTRDPALVDIATKQLQSALSES